MNELQFADDVMARIRAKGGAYHERAYLFVLATIEYLQSRLEMRRHVSGAELAWACRDFAREQFDPSDLPKPTRWEFDGVG